MNDDAKINIAATTAMQVIDTFGEKRLLKPCKYYLPNMTVSESGLTISR